MSVRATGSLIGDLVKVTALRNSPAMVVKDVDEENKKVTTVWFSDCNSHQEGIFPASALDRVKVEESKKAGEPQKGKKTSVTKSTKK